MILEEDWELLAFGIAENTPMIIVTRFDLVKIFELLKLYIMKCGLHMTWYMERTLSMISWLTQLCR